MVFTEANDFLEILRGALPLYTVIVLPILIILCPLDPVLGAHEFAVYRMQQFDLHGTAFGCRSATISVEARTLNSKSYTRRGVLAHILHLTLDKYREIISQFPGGLIVILPSDFTSLSEEDIQHINYLEKALVEEETSVPVYFAVETPELLSVYREVEDSVANNNMETTSDVIRSSLTANGFQLVVNSPQPKALSDIQVTTVWGKLVGHGIEENLPSVVIVAHYDAFGIAPALSFGADSNGSGLVALLELARLFSRLYSSLTTKAKYNLVFLVSGAGKFNYQGTKKWIEDSLDNAEGSFLQEASFTLCLDTIGSGDELYLHVSKPPKEGTPGDLFFRELAKLSNHLKPSLKFDMVHKKINLADDMLAWEHERFSIRRLPAFTLSRLSSPKNPRRNTVLDTRKNVDLTVLSSNVQMIAEALARLIYNMSESDTTQIFTNSIRVQKEFMRSWLDYLSSQPRSAQLFLENSRNGFVTTLEHLLNAFLTDVKLSYTKPDKRDPEFVFYDATSSTLTACSVKPALFDLLVFIGVALYLAVIYFAIQRFSWLISFVRVSNKVKVK